jgi:hypothetical protein
MIIAGYGRQAKNANERNVSNVLPMQTARLFKFQRHWLLSNDLLTDFAID